jgi:organic radical activating enzyme
MITQVIQRWPKNKLRIEIMIGNTCNYKCWYCFPGSNEGTHRWPEFNLFKENLTHLLRYYQRQLKKEVFEIHLIGGEPTLWPELGDFVKFLKENFKVIISMSTNGSRTLRWWKDYGKYFDKVLLSCHHEKVDVQHIKNVGDILYDQNVIVTGMILMDSAHWDKCKSILFDVITSKKRWGVDVQEIIHPTIKYTQEQTEFLRKHRYRQANLWYFFKNNKHTILNTRVVFENGKTKKIQNNEIILNKWNNFKGWDCNLGIDSIFISKEGNITGACGENLYNLNYKFNILKETFIQEFNPILTSTICTKNSCWCQPESNLNKKIIPISSV